MNVPAKLAAYGLVLALCLGAGAAVGAAVGPIDVGGASDHAPEPTTPTPVPHSGHQEGH